MAEQTFQNEVDERTSLAGSNRFEMLLFHLGLPGGEGEDSPLFGINVFKIREIVEMPSVTEMVGTVDNMMGVVNLRGQVIPVFDLPGIVGCKPKSKLNLLLVTEFAQSTQGFAVEAVEDIVRLDWNQVRPAEGVASGGFVTSIARLDGDLTETRLAQVLDVESILRKLTPNAKPIETSGDVGKLELPAGTIILAADDSVVARSLIEQGLNAMGAPFVMTKSGKECWEKLHSIAHAAEAEGKTVHDKVAMILTDLEMPEMDGFTLTRNIKQNAKFKQLPVVIHSSLTGSANEDHVRSIGADGYVAKFDLDLLGLSLRQVLGTAV